MAIKEAAILYKGVVYSLPRPKRHHHIIKHIVKCTRHKRVFGVQGFITDYGFFVNRFVGKSIAIKCGQLIARAGSSKRLYSEDLW